MPTTDPICPRCGAEMTLVFKNRRRTYLCQKCTSDPFKSPVVKDLLDAPALKPPERS